MKKNLIVLALLVIGVLTAQVFGQADGSNKNGADRTLHGSGRVNPSTLAAEVDIPLGSYPGRGLNLPMGLSYSSKVWRMEATSPIPIVNSTGCYYGHQPIFSENSSGGWTSSLQIPYVEYVSADTLYDGNGHPVSDPCDPNAPGPSAYGYVRRMMIHLPGGETHEVRMNDDVLTYSPSDDCSNLNNQSCELTNPARPNNWTGWYSAADSSNLRYYEDRSNGIYYLLLPDGSRMDFAGGNPTSVSQNSTGRLATKLTDRNGNFITYNPPTTQYPNGTWTDTLGRTVVVPIGFVAPTAPATLTYAAPSLGAIGATPAQNYHLYWRYLKDTTAAASAIVDFTLPLKHPGSEVSIGNPANPRPATDCLFQNVSMNAVFDGDLGAYFNPVLLSVIELPDGEHYKLSYDQYGRLARIDYPGGGAETFAYSQVAALSAPDFHDVNPQTNFGVTSRQVFATTGTGAPHNDWTYAVDATSGYKVTTTAPDLTYSRRFLYLSNPTNCTGCTFGYDQPLAGRAYEEDFYSAGNQLLSKKLTTWTTSQFQSNISVLRDWHPRVTKEESIVYDQTTNSPLSTTAAMDYTDLSQTAGPVNVATTKQYGFSTTIGTPGVLQKTVQTTYITDTNYTALNLRSLPSIVQTTDLNNNPVAQSQIFYDEAVRLEAATVTTLAGWTNLSSSIRALPTAVRKWTDVANNQYVETHAEYDQFGNVRKSWDANHSSDPNTFTAIGFSSTYNYAYPTTVTTPAPDSSGANGSSTGFTTTTYYDINSGLPTSTVDPNNQTTTMEYNDALLRPTKVTAPNGQQTTTDYGVPDSYTGQLATAQRFVHAKTQIDASNWKEGYSWFDGLGRTTSTQKKDTAGDIFTQTQYDNMGRVSTVSNPYRNVSSPVCGSNIDCTTNTYDALGRTLTVTTPDNEIIQTAYALSTTGVVGMTKTITDQAGKKRKGISDALGRMIRVIEDPDSQNLATDYVFDTLGNLRETTQGSQNRYFMYDSSGRLLYARQPEQDVNSAFVATDPITSNTQWTVKYQYDNDGNITSTTNARNVSVTGGYDNLNRLKTRTYSDNTTPNVSFYYDGTGLGSVPSYSNGKVTKVTSSVSENRYTSFDNMGRTLASQQITDGQTYGFGYTYNLSGELISETYPSTRVVQNVVNQNGDLSLVQSKKNQNSGFWDYASGFAYTAAGAVSAMKLGNGHWETAVFNNRLQTTQIGLGLTSGDQKLLQLVYGYTSTQNSTDNNGSLRSQSITIQPSGSNSLFAASQSYSYDSLNRLLSATETFSTTQSWKQTFIYDRYGNRTFDAANTTTLSQSNNVTNPTVSTSNNRFSTGQSYSYNANGDLTQDAEGRQFAYDGESRQSSFGTGGSNTNGGTYLYDGEGKRIKKITGTETTVFVYDGAGQLAAEYSILTTIPPPQVSYLTMDTLGSPRVITDQNGQVTSRRDYAAFGDETFTVQRTQGLGYKPDSVRQDYTGYEVDGESGGLEYAQARYYNTKHGRFTSVDPLTASATIRDPQTFNRYSYALNSPYKFTDPLGLIYNGAGNAGRPDNDNNGGSEFCSSAYDTCSEAGGEELSTESINAHRIESERRARKDAALKIINKAIDVSFGVGSTTRTGKKVTKAAKKLIKELKKRAEVIYDSAYTYYTEFPVITKDLSGDLQIIPQPNPEDDALIAASVFAKDYSNEKFTATRKNGESGIFTYDKPGLEEVANKIFSLTIASAHQDVQSEIKEKERNTIENQRRLKSEPKESR